MTHPRRKHESLMANLRPTEIEKTGKGSLLDYVLTLEPDEEFAEELEKVINERK